MEIRIESGLDLTTLWSDNARSRHLMLKKR